MIIRRAKPDDAGRLSEIYGYYVENTAISFEYAAPSADEFRERIERISASYPYLAAQDEETGRIMGYAYASRYKERAAYSHCCEVSIYLDKDARKQGLGRMLYEALEKELADMGILNLYACVTCPAGDPDEYSDMNSAEFHARMGYETVGRMHKCGNKFGRWYDTLWMEKFLGDHADEEERRKA